MKNQAQDRPNQLYNIKQFENFLINEGATVDCPEFQLYKSLPVYEDEYGEEYYGVDEVHEIMKEDQGPEFVRHTQAEVVQYWTPAGC